jgi:hypothetical protein
MFPSFRIVLGTSFFLIVLLFDDEVGIFKLLDSCRRLVKRYLVGAFIFADAISLDSTPRSLFLLPQKA